MIDVRDFCAVVNVLFPAVEIYKRDKFSEVRARLSEPFTARAEFSVVAEYAGHIKSARIRTEGMTVEVCFTKRFVTSGSTYELHAPSATINDAELALGSGATWKNHPQLEAGSQVDYPRVIIESWTEGLVLKQESVGVDGVISQAGLRAPQLGAIHALAAHWSVKTSHAKVVLPTGTGKTDVMIAASVMRRARRTLVLVPSDALRTQISEKFLNLGVLAEVGAVTETVLRPLVGKLTKSPRIPEDAVLVRAANVVVSTTHMLLGMSQEVLEDFLSQFDLVLFDEAHHLPSASWMRIKGNLGDRSRVVSVTATPYRNDGKRVPGELIYQFPLRMAQEQGYFTSISVVRVDESNPDRADIEIARKAVEALRRDHDKHDYNHIILARARSVEHANVLYEMYQREFPDLEPVVLHSGLGLQKKRSAVAGLREMRHRIVVCVDMLGEGFDLPALKIAALHDLHKSLPITLQFIGRFTRTSRSVGGATVVINMAEPMAETTVAELFSEDADWNELIPDLSARAIKSEQDLAVFMDSMRESMIPEEKKFDMALLKPKTSVTMYSASEFRPELVTKGISKSSTVHQSWLNEDQDLLVFITQDRIYPDWSMSRDAVSFEWNLWIIAYDEDAGLLYINSTQGNSKLSSLARAVSGQNAKLQSGEKMFRVFDGLHRSILHNVGLYRRGQLRFQMLAGLDIGGHVNSAIQAGSGKSNLFAVGYDNGKRTNVGASFKGRIWSMSTSSIPDWVVWCKKMAKKVFDDRIATNSYLKFTLIPTEVTRRPSIDVFACLPPDELLPGDYHGEKKISVYGDSMSYSQVDISFEKASASGPSVLIDVSIGQKNSAVYKLDWEGEFRVSQVSGSRIRLLVDSSETSLQDYLTLHAPPLLLRDGSELIGKYHFSLPNSLPYTFSSESILPLDWGKTPIRTESKWRNGASRDSSVQGTMIDKCLVQENSFVIDDDGTGEAADIIVIKDDRNAKELDITLYHCKYASGNEPSARYGDLYEVCGQAVKSSRLLHRSAALLAHIIRREEHLGGRPTRFEKGTLDEIRSLQRRMGLYRTHLNICVVQPGLSASALTPDLSAILGAADGFILEFTGRRMRVFGSQ